MEFRGRWITGSPWDRFGLYNSYVLVRGDGAIRKIAAHSGELVPGSTEDLVAALKTFDSARGRLPCPMTLELDPTWQCASVDCGGHCFSKTYRALAPRAALSTAMIEEILREFAMSGGRIVRFDGGGDPLLHPGVRSGALTELVHNLGLKSTILTAGDLFRATDLSRIAGANCYVRVSLNAATNETRRRFHRNTVTCDEVFEHIEILTKESAIPVGATFLFGQANYHEVFDAAVRARDCGISHFSVRRVLGPPDFRADFGPAEVVEAQELLAKVRAMHSDKFRVFVPWRGLNDPDMSPARGDFTARQCWQSTLKVIVEPKANSKKHAMCGRYRGGGIGQLMQLPSLDVSPKGAGWVQRWQGSFENFPVRRELLPRICVSCIDHGFIRMVDEMVAFLGDPSISEFEVLHLSETLDEERL
jgi:hypothetical protein